VDNKKNIRKASWLYEDLAWKIATPTPTVKAVLALLAKQANNAGKSFAGYEYIRACTDIKSDTTVSSAIQFLRDELKILTWIPGGRGFANSNRYTLDLTVMKTIVKTQERFHPETGKLIGVTPMVVDGLSPMTVDTPVPVKTNLVSNGCNLPPNGCESDSNHWRGTLNKSNPPQTQPPKGESVDGRAGDCFEGASSRALLTPPARVECNYAGCNDLPPTFVHVRIRQLCSAPSPV
jgi:hypothetical protein